MYLKEISLKKQIESNDFPFNLPFVRQFDRLTFNSDVTILVGENGSGKSTLLESLASVMNLPTVGRANISDDDTLDSQRRLGQLMRLSWSRINRRGFFLRAEDFFNFSIFIRKEKEELKTLADEYDKTLTGYGHMLATGAANSQINGLREKYGEDLDKCSHGESFLKLFSSRLVPGGIYILDEPEAPLSPLRQLTLLSMMKEMTDCQFIIATHSPILMAYPNAQILSFEEDDIRETTFEEIEHVKVMKDFLNNPDSFLRYL